MNYLAIERASVNNGTGIRCVLWISGCHHKCDGCHNPQSWDFSAGKEFTLDTLDYILSYLDNDMVDGITFSGGDPLAQENIKTVMFVAKMIKRIYGDRKSIWCYTGYTIEELNNREILNYIDVLVDGEYKKEQRNLSLPFRGSDNQRIICLHDKM